MNHTRTLQEVVCIESNKWKHKFVNNVTVNYVTTILLKSKYPSKCLNQSRSVAVNKDQIKPYNGCHFILTRIYLYALDTSTPLLM